VQDPEAIEIVDFDPGDAGPPNGNQDAYAMVHVSTSYHPSTGYLRAKIWPEALTLSRNPLVHWYPAHAKAAFFIPQAQRPVSLSTRAKPIKCPLSPAAPNQSSTQCWLRSGMECAEAA
jgi:hypothetical protein